MAKTEQDLGSKTCVLTYIGRVFANEGENCVMKVKVNISILAATVLLLSQCTSDKSPPPPDLSKDSTSVPDTLTYQADIKPIFQANCAKSGCHNNATILGYALREYEGIKQGVLEGRVLGAINHREGYYPMPNGQKLPDSTIQKVERWADSGAPENAPVIFEPE